ncbi:MAG: GvpL/GvpF family gas vesicle protein [Solirubrobacterales bacterium]|nr:GvpL/GvpF family gas vesicle protein [Solirubrobacterales bacterium]
MSLLLYGIVEAGDGPEVAGVGVDEQPLRGVPEASLLAIVSDHRGRAPDPTTNAMLAYERAVRRVMDGGAVLPVQFGSVLDDEAAVRELLRRRRKDLLAQLDRVRGAVEIGLRASWRDRERVTDRGRKSGTSYLRDRLELRQNARRVASELDPLTAVARSSRRALAPRPDLPVLDSYLVDRARVSEFVALVAQLDHRLDDVELVCTGPWPPYSFAEGTPR